MRYLISMSLFAPCAERFTWAGSFSCTAARWPSTHAPEFCECSSSSEGSCESLTARRRVFTCSQHVRAFVLSRALSLLCLLCRGLVSAGACCCGALAPTCSGPCAVVWNTCTRHFCCSVTPLLLSVLAQTAPSTSSAASGRCSRISHRDSLWKVLSFLRAVSSELLCRCRRFTTTASVTSFRRGILAGVSCAHRLLTKPSAS